MRNRLKIAANLFGWVLGIGFLVHFWQKLLTEEQGWGEIFANLDMGILMVAFGFIIVANIVRSQMGYISNTSLGYPLAPQQSYRIWVMSQMARYIPGGVWQVATKSVLYNRNGTPLLISSAITVMELTAELTAMLVMGVGLGIFIPDTFKNMGQFNLILVGGVLLVMLVVASQTLGFWQVLTRFRLNFAPKMVDMLTQLGTRRFKVMALLLALTGTAYLIALIGFYVLLMATGFADTISLSQAMASFAIAWVVGLLVIISPSGLGPRELTLTLLLSPALGPTDAFSVALLARLWWTLGETVHIAIVGLWSLLTAVSARSSEPSREPADSVS
jgi:glycosyltransferase 2 family protein